MKHITEQLKKRLATKKLSHTAKGSLSVQLAKQFAQYPQQVSGYIRRHALFLKLDAREDRSKWFARKKEIMQTINAGLKEFGYNYTLQDVRFFLQDTEKHER